MTIDVAVTADAATVDSSGKLNLLGVFDRIQAREFPARHGRICLVLRIVAEPVDAGDHKAEIRLLDPDGKVLVRIDGNVHIGPGTGDVVSRIPHVLNLDGIIFPKPGRYRFEVEVDGEPLATLPLTLLGDGGPASTQDRVPVFFSPGGPAEA